MWRTHLDARFAALFVIWLVLQPKAPWCTIALGEKIIRNDSRNFLILTT